MSDETPTSEFTANARSRVTAAVPGPYDTDIEMRVIYVVSGNNRLAGVGMSYDPKSCATAELFAHAPEDIAGLCDRLEAILEWAREQSEGWDDPGVTDFEDRYATAAHDVLTILGEK